MRIQDSLGLFSNQQESPKGRVSGRTRKPTNLGQADYTPIFLSQVPSLFRRRLVPHRATGFVA